MPGLHLTLVKPVSGDGPAQASVPCRSSAHFNVQPGLRSLGFSPFSIPTRFFPFSRSVAVMCGCASEFPGGLLKTGCWAQSPDFLIHQHWGEGTESAYLTSPHVMLMVLVVGPPFENHCFITKLQWLAALRISLMSLFLLFTATIFSSPFLLFSNDKAFPFNSHSFIHLSIDNSQVPETCQEWFSFLSIKLFFPPSLDINGSSCFAASVTISGLVFALGVCLFFF